MKHMNQDAKMRADGEVTKLKSELRMLRMEHSELISNTNVGD